MAYTPNNWKDGDVITAEKMNKIENAVSPLIITLTGETTSNGQPYVNATADDVLAALEAGKCLIFHNIIHHSSYD